MMSRVPLGEGINFFAVASGVDLTAVTNSAHVVVRVGIARSYIFSEPTVFAVAAQFPSDDTATAVIVPV